MKRIPVFVFFVIFLYGCSISQNIRSIFIKEQQLSTNPKINEIYKGLMAKENKEYKKAFDIFDRYAKSGNDEAMYELGMMYLEGIGTIKDYSLALNNFRLAGYNANSKALRAAGYMYEFGFGMKKNLKKAIKYYELALGLGNSLAEYNLASLYFDIDDIKNAKIHFKNACLNGIKAACDRIR